ncbi:MAG TPA: DUF2950 family protein, partial [Planctomycetota bacterium]|nr:DUF2950 family protein [Planctomycetota bacterium]
AAIALPGLLSSQRASNERTASTTIKTLTAAEADFRANDRDHNGVNDFWTGDVSGLYSLTVDGHELQLIPREVAEADAAPIKPLVPVPVPYQGYLFRALERDAAISDAGEAEYRKDTGGNPPMGKVHNTSKFGFIAYPVRFGETGKYSFMVNENNTVFRRPEDGTNIRDFPSDEDLMGLRVKHEQAPPTPMRSIPNAVSELPRTIVTAHLLEKHQSGKNLIWCATVQQAWDELGRLLKVPLDLRGSPPMAGGLNRHLVGEQALPPGKYYARAGFFRDGILDTIRKDMAERFPNALVPAFPAPSADDEALAFAYLFTDLPFNAPLYRHAGISFRGRKVAAFGLWEGHPKKPTDEQMKQILVRDFRSPGDFVVELVPKAGGERMIVAKVEPGATLLDTVSSVLSRAENPPGAFRGQDDLMIPCVNFDLQRVYAEVLGPEHGFVKAPGWILDARQRIRFRFDEQGALLESTAYFWTTLNGDPPKGRKMICDGPFLILLAREGAKMPYFAFWVDNDELLIR